MCHGQFVSDEHNHVEVTSDIHVCADCKPYQSQPVAFFTWFILLERLYRQRGLEEVPRGGQYTEDWPIQYYNQGLTPEDALETIETAVA